MGSYAGILHLSHFIFKKNGLPCLEDSFVQDPNRTLLRSNRKNNFYIRGGFIMIKVVAKSEIKENQIETYKGLARELIHETRKEQGCIDYELFQDIEHHNICTFIEAWEDKDALDRHMKSAHFERIVPRMAQLKENPSEINVYQLVF
jgi:quinol monooxygenase YgiN